MWDVNRSSMQTLDTFMRVDFMAEYAHKKFDQRVYTRKYETTIEPDDQFRLEYRFASNSIMLRVISNIVWPISLILMDFIMSMRIISLRL